LDENNAVSMELMSFQMEWKADKNASQERMNNC